MKVAGVTIEEVRDAILNNPDFIAVPRYHCSLKELLQRHPDGVSIETQSQALVMSAVDVEIEYEKALTVLRSALC